MGGCMLINFKGRPLLGGCMLMNSRGGPPLGTISMDFLKRIFRFKI